MTAYDQIERQFQRKGEATGTPTGFTDLDDITSGLQATDLIILAARPSMGKTALALNIAHHVAMKERLPVAVFSLEMSKDQLVQRLICSKRRSTRATSGAAFCKIPTGTASRTRSTTCIRHRFSLMTSRRKHF
jgi:replicative DNA helicase